MTTIFRKIFRLVKKYYFKKKFRSFPFNSGIGKDGCGRGCKLSGTRYMTIGEDCYFGESTELVALDKHFDQFLNPSLIIGDHVRCVGGCRITCAGNIKIEDDVLLGPGVFITDHNHGMCPETDGGYSRQPLLINDVIIGNGVWLGQRVIILPGVTVGAHSIIGANSVVTHNIEPYTIAVGSPARKVKKWDHQKQAWVRL